MKPLFDVKCDTCGHIFEERKQYKDPASCCPECGSAYTRTLLTGFKSFRDKDPYDMLNDTKLQRTGKKIRSFANDRRRGGKDTT